MQSENDVPVASYPPTIFTAVHAEALLTSLKNIRPDFLPPEDDAGLAKVVRDFGQLTLVFFKLKNQEFQQRQELEKLKQSIYATNESERQQIDKSIAAEAQKLENSINTIVRSSYSISLCMKNYIGLLNVYTSKRLLAAIETVEGIHGSQHACYEGLLAPEQVDEVHKSQKTSEAVQRNTEGQSKNDLREERITQQQFPQTILDVITALSPKERVCFAEHLKARRDLSMDNQVQFRNSYTGGIISYASCMAPYEEKVTILAKTDTEYTDSEGKVCVLRKGVIRQVFWYDIKELLLKDQVVVWENAY